MSENTEKKAKEESVASEKWKAIGVIVAAIFSAIGVIATAYFGFLAVKATQAPSIKPTASPPNPVISEDIVLTDRAEIFGFDGGSADGWKPLKWDTGWIIFEKSGDIEVVGDDVTLNKHTGPFLKYPLDLESEKRNTSLHRNAIYKPIANEQIIGILANIYYESEDEDAFKEVRASFVAPFEANGVALMQENFSQRLLPNKWNTIVWSLYSPVWWSAKEKDEKWAELVELFGNEASSLQVGRRLDNNTIDWIGIQFFVQAEDDPEKFKGMVYLDNITIIYKQAP